MRQLHVLLVPQAFKGTLSVQQVAGALQRAATGLNCKVRTIPGSDGGDGLLGALEGSLRRTSQVVAAGPLGAPTEGIVGWLDDATAVLESRLWCGLSLLPKGAQNPLVASTRGVGDAIGQVLKQGARRVFVGLGGSATVDGGTGLARAFGWRFLDAAGTPLPEGGGALEQLATVERHAAPVGVVTALVDVRNALLGPDGAVVYAPQKGATPADVGRLSRGLERLVAVLSRSDAGAAARAALPGAGAAGGLGFALSAVLGADIVHGAWWVLERAGFDAAVREADLVVTGEGAFDATSLEGKLTGEVIRRATAAGVPVALLAPRVSVDPGVAVVETGGSPWDEAAVERAATRAMDRGLRLPRP